MTPKKAKKLLPVMAAYAEGKVVQWRSHNDRWIDYLSESAACHPDLQQPAIFMNPRFEWRVKPEPREWWLCRYKESTDWSIWENEPPSDQFEPNPHLYEVAHVREVLP